MGGSIGGKGWKKRTTQTSRKQGDSYRGNGKHGRKGKEEVRKKKSQVEEAPLQERFRSYSERASTSQIPQVSAVSLGEPERESIWKMASYYLRKLLDKGITRSDQTEDGTNANQAEGKITKKF